VTASKVVVPTPAEILSWPATVGAVQAGSCWDLGEDAVYDLIRTGGFPVPVLKLGRGYRVTRSSIMAALGIPETAIAAPSKSLASGHFSQVQGVASDSRSEASSSRIAA
jgi:hypothetical protein